ncbi:MAG TPA: glutathione S-transferase family protein [Dongiaceae bacterium]|jgi:glutathione S-transferase|nr:glutathione S-transferase family protein [Dongiaceae bacterium]
MSGAPIFYGNHLSGHSYKVALLLALLGIEAEYRHVNLALPHAERPQAFRESNFFEEVPVLQHGTRTFCQSNVILLYLAETYGGYLGNSAEDKWRILEWLSWETNRIGFSVSNLRFAYRFARNRDDGAIVFLRGRALKDLARMEQHLKGHDFLIGERPTIADIASCGYLFWADEAHLDIRQWPATTAWLHRIRDLPRWATPEILLAKERSVLY